MDTAVPSAQRVGEYDAYHARVGDRPSTYAVSILRHKNTPVSRVLDLGAGYLRDARYFIRNGCEHVTAVDKERPPQCRFLPGISFEQSSIEAFEPEADSYDACNASSSLFFCPQKTLFPTFRKLHRALKPGSIFACNLLGENDSWVAQRGPEKVSWLKGPEIPTLIDGFHPILCEDTPLSKGFSGQKTWHVHVLILRRK